MSDDRDIRIFGAQAVARRHLGETIAELALGLLEVAAAAPGRATGVELTLPLEIRLSADGEGLIGELPLFRRATAFDPPTSDLFIRLVEVPA